MPGGYAHRQTDLFLAIHHRRSKIPALVQSPPQSYQISGATNPPTNPGIQRRSRPHLSSFAIQPAHATENHQGWQSIRNPGQQNPSPIPYRQPKRQSNSDRCHREASPLIGDQALDQSSQQNKVSGDSRILRHLIRIGSKSLRPFWRRQMIADSRLDEFEQSTFGIGPSLVLGIANIIRNHFVDWEPIGSDNIVPKKSGIAPCIIWIRADAGSTWPVRELCAVKSASARLSTFVNR